MCENTQKLSVGGLNWVIKDPNKETFHKLDRETDISSILKTIISKRDLSSLTMKQYLKPTLKELTPNPFDLHDMEKAINTLYDAILNNDKLGILGDYDVDGVTSSALIYNYLIEIGFNNVQVFIPDREKDGYGLSKNAVDFFLEKSINLVICLDCGTNDTKIVNYAKRNKIKIIVIDHHEQKQINLPHALVNPKKNNDNSELNYLATAGLVFLFLVALNRKLKKYNFFSKKIEGPELRKYLDLVALGTVCDLVPLIKANRLFVKKGIIEINNKKNKGIKTLLEKLNINEIVSESDLGFYLGPCINAPGRIGDSTLGFKVLCIKSDRYYSNIADTLLNNNQERKTLENIAYKQAKKKISAFKGNNKISKKFILVYDRNWHSGIIGIIASRLTNEYTIPSIVISHKNNNSKGSIRSVRGVSASEIVNFLNEKNVILNGGGHNMAAGFTLSNSCMEKIENLLQTYFSSIVIKKQKSLKIDIILDLFKVNVELIEKIKQIGPFGQENEEPRVALKNLKVAFKKEVGKSKEHIFCILEDYFGKTINAIAFNQSSTKLGKTLFSEKVFNVAGKLRLYKKENQLIPQFIIEDILIL